MAPSARLLCLDRKSTRLNSSHGYISYAVFCLKKNEIWTRWSQLRVQAQYVVPDGLAWGRIQGYETLFWLEVGDGHKSRDLFKGYGDHRDLHSFPTRRSSDLPGGFAILLIPGRLASVPRVGSSQLPHS